MNVLLTLMEENLVLVQECHNLLVCFVTVYGYCFSRFFFHFLVVFCLDAIDMVLHVYFFFKKMFL